MDGARRGLALLAAATLWLAASPLHAQDTAYKCSSRGGTTYADRPCPGGRVLGPAGPRRIDKARAVPQDRARIARRAALSEADRAECKALDAKLAGQKAELKAKGDAVTLDDEMPMVFTQKRFRELHC
ncbi:MAG: hypothetical protein EOO25_21630 [Comamonadaceae bacterium]|nr:MAG: hypothetical protein EOO25_21630 [Comamonadaceae bacterium]